MVKMSKDNTMGNQQVTETNLAWLAGIWDGEGTFGIYGYRRPNDKKKRWSYCARLTLSNTSKEMIAEIKRIFDAVGIVANLWKAKIGRKDTHKLEVHITVDRMESVRKGCELMMPYLIVKKERAKILVDFLAIRAQYKRKVDRDPKTGRLTGMKEQGYPSECIALYKKMRLLNQIGNGTSETIRRAPKKVKI